MQQNQQFQRWNHSVHLLNTLFWCRLIRVVAETPVPANTVLSRGGDGGHETDYTQPKSAGGKLKKAVIPHPLLQLMFGGSPVIG